MGRVTSNPENKGEGKESKGQSGEGSGGRKGWGDEFETHPVEWTNV